MLVWRRLLEAAEAFDSEIGGTGRGLERGGRVKNGGTAASGGAKFAPMRLRMLPLLWVGTMILGELGCASRTAAVVPQMSDPKDAVQREILQQALLPDGKELRLMLIEYAPGVAAPVHTHPVAGTCFVLEGEVESRYEGEDAKNLQSGDSYKDFANRTHLVWRNRSDTNPLKFLCAAHIAPDQPFAEPVK